MKLVHMKDNAEDTSKQPSKYDHEHPDNIADLSALVACYKYQIPKITKKGVSPQECEKITQSIRGENPTLGALGNCG